jgi:hypothetical protein
LSTDFTGRKLQQCLDVIHHDIISVWNIRESNVRPYSHQMRSCKADVSSSST